MESDKSFSAIGYKVNSTPEFETVLRKAIKSIDVPVIIAVDVDYSRNSVLLNDEYCNLPSK